MNRQEKLVNVRKHLRHILTRRKHHAPKRKTIKVRRHIRRLASLRLPKFNSEKEVTQFVKKHNKNAQKEYDAWKEAKDSEDARLEKVRSFFQNKYDKEFKKTGIKKTVGPISDEMIAEYDEYIKGTAQDYAKGRLEDENKAIDEALDKAKTVIKNIEKLPEETIPGRLEQLNELQDLESQELDKMGRAQLSLEGYMSKIDYGVADHIEVSDAVAETEKTLFDERQKLKKEISYLENEKKALTSMKKSEDITDDSVRSVAKAEGLSTVADEMLELEKKIEVAKDKIKNIQSLGYETEDTITKSRDAEKEMEDLYRKLTTLEFSIAGKQTLELMKMRGHVLSEKEKADRLSALEIKITSAKNKLDTIGERFKYLKEVPKMSPEEFVKNILAVKTPEIKGTETDTEWDSVFSSVIGKGKMAERQLREQQKEIDSANKLINKALVRKTFYEKDDDGKITYLDPAGADFINEYGLRTDKKGNILESDLVKLRRIKASNEAKLERLSGIRDELSGQTSRFKKMYDAYSISRAAAWTHGTARDLVAEYGTRSTQMIPDLVNMTRNYKKTDKEMAEANLPSIKLRIKEIDDKTKNASIEQIKSAFTMAKTLNMEKLPPFVLFAMYGAALGKRSDDEGPKFGKVTPVGTKTGPVSRRSYMVNAQYAAKKLWEDFSKKEGENRLSQEEIDIMTENYNDAIKMAGVPSLLVNLKSALRTFAGIKDDDELNNAIKHITGKSIEDFNKVEEEVQGGPHGHINTYEEGKYIAKKLMADELALFAMDFAQHNPAAANKLKRDLETLSKIDIQKMKLNNKRDIIDWFDNEITDPKLRPYARNLALQVFDDGLSTVTKNIREGRINRGKNKFMSGTRLYKEAAVIATKRRKDAALKDFSGDENLLTLPEMKAFYHMFVGENNTKRRALLAAMEPIKEMIAQASVTVRGIDNKSIEDTVRKVEKTSRPYAMNESIRKVIQNIVLIKDPELRRLWGSNADSTEKQNALRTAERKYWAEVLRNRRTNHAGRVAEFKADIAKYLDGLSRSVNRTVDQTNRQLYKYGLPAAGYQLLPPFSPTAPSSTIAINKRIEGVDNFIKGNVNALNAVQKVLRVTPGKAKQMTGEGRWSQRSESDVATQVSKTISGLRSQGMFAWMPNTYMPARKIMGELNRIQEYIDKAKSENRKPSDYYLQKKKELSRSLFLEFQERAPAYQAFEKAAEKQKGKAVRRVVKFETSHAAGLGLLMKSLIDKFQKKIFDGGYLDEKERVLAANIYAYAPMMPRQATFDIKRTIHPLMFDRKTQRLIPIPGRKPKLIPKKSMTINEYINSIVGDVDLAGQKVLSAFGKDPTLWSKYPWETQQALRASGNLSQATGLVPTRENVASIIPKLDVDHPVKALETAMRLNLSNKEVNAALSKGRKLIGRSPKTERSGSTIIP
jgi:hypothetical protein